MGPSTRKGSAIEKRKSKEEPGTRRYTDPVPSWFLLIVASVLLGMFVVSYVYSLFNTNYTVPGPIYGIVIIIVGYIFGSEAVKGMKR